MYTAGVVLPKPVATCKYFHRSLNPIKLLDVGFSHLRPRMTRNRTAKLFKLPSVSKLVTLLAGSTLCAEDVLSSSWWCVGTGHCNTWTASNGSQGCEGCGCTAENLSVQVGWSTHTRYTHTLHTRSLSTLYLSPSPPLFLSLSLSLNLHLEGKARCCRKQQATSEKRSYSTALHPLFPNRKTGWLALCGKERWQYYRTMATLARKQHKHTFTPPHFLHLCPISSPTSPTRPCFVFALGPLPTLTSVLVVRRFALWSEWDDTEAAHWLLPRANVIDSFVVQVLMPLQAPLLTRSLT